MKRQYTDRFEREARAITALNDPRICAIHDVGQHDGLPYLVMEHIEGEPLKGPVPQAIAVRYGIEICLALDVAHRKGIVHRDLKPANILVTKRGIKLLDFGLARQDTAAVAASAATPADNTATLVTAPENTMSGTPAYMAPEQVEGKSVDARADIFSFGCVMYELLSGTRPFTGSSVTAVLASVLAAEPKPVREVAADTSPALAAIVRKCLNKEPDARWQSAADIAAALELLAEAQPAMPAVLPWHRRLLPGAAAGLLLCGVVGGAAAWLWPRPARPGVVRLELAAPTGQSPQGVTVSPDGSMIAFRSVDGNKPGRIWVRSLDSLSVRPVPGTDGATTGILWSPDSRRLAFRVGAEFKSVGITGDDLRVIGTAQNASVMQWLEDGRVLVNVRTSPVMALATESGEMKPLTRLNSSFGDTGHFGHTVLPEHGLLLYEAETAKGKSQFRLAKLATGEDVTVVAIEGKRFSWDSAGYLVYATTTALVARRFDPASGKFSGSPVNLAEVPALSPGGAPVFGLSRTGVLAYRTPPSLTLSQLGIYDRNGRQQATLGEPADYSNPAVSPDGKLVAVGIRSLGGKRDIWVIDLARGSSTQLTRDDADDFNPTWSPDGKRMVFASDRLGTRDLFIRDVETTNPEKVLLQEPLDQTPEHWSRDGRWLFFNSTTSGAVNLSGTHVQALAMDGDARAKPLVATDPRYVGYHSDLSPDGKFIAFDSFTTLARIVYARNFPDTGARWPISAGPGEEPRFSRDGKEIFFYKDGQLWAVPVSAGGGRLSAGIPKALFRIELPILLRNRIVVMPDGRLLINTAVPKPTRLPIAAVVNWRSLLKN